ncbi:50S ribosomal protein L29 [Patescibacteria group bacterium]|jgi:ribosomal protein L29|nr:50S ribosomal protein L29 [Candidatus Uhrbacteria bacterium]MCK9361196.1 50S ribosomal protein L29 [Patescibacteria group bacterium]
MEAKELKSKSQAELTRMGDELRAELRAIRFKVATRQHGKVRDLRRLRRDLARIEAARTNATT